MRWQEKSVQIKCENQFLHQLVFFKVNATGRVAGYQLRDLRAKAGTDTADASGDIRTAQKQLGHKNLSMTEHYIKKRRGDRVNPTR